MGTVVSTIPGAIETLKGYLDSIAATNPLGQVPLGTYYGYQTPLAAMAANFMMVGDYEEGILHGTSTGTWARLPAMSKERTEEYHLNGALRCWQGGNDQVRQVLDNAFTLLNALQTAVVNDPGGSGNLSASGSWGALEFDQLANGPLATTAGWGVVYGFTLQVENVRLYGD